MSNKPIVCHSLRNNTLDAIIGQCDAECRAEKMDQPVVREGVPGDSSENNTQVMGMQRCCPSSGTEYWMQQSYLYLA